MAAMANRDGTGMGAVAPERDPWHRKEARAQSREWSCGTEQGAVAQDREPWHRDESGAEPWHQKGSHSTFNEFINPISYDTLYVP